MLLLGEQLARYSEESDELLADVLRLPEPLGEEGDLRNDATVRFGHHHRSEQLL